MGPLGTVDFWGRGASDHAGRVTGAIAILCSYLANTRFTNASAGPVDSLGVKVHNGFSAKVGS